MQQQQDGRSIWIMRFLFATYWGSLGALQPYLPIYYQSLKLSGQVIGILGAITPFTTFLVAPLWGVLSDKTGKPFTILYITFFISVVGQVLVCFQKDQISIMVMVFLTAFFRAPVKPLIDSIVMANLTERSYYGRLRLFGQLGFGFGTSVVGFLINTNSDEEPLLLETDGATTKLLAMLWQTMNGYRLPFLCHGLTSFASFLCIHAFHKMHQEKQLQRSQQHEEGDKEEEGEKQQEETKEKCKEDDVNVWEAITVLLHNGDVIFFFVLIFVVGFSSGAIENFCYVRMRETGLSGKTLGLSRLVSSIAGAPMFWFSGQIGKRLGAETVLVLTVVSFAARFTLYALMTHPVYGFIAEGIRGVTFAVFWSTAVIYANRIAPPGLGATMPTLLNAIYAGIANSLGAMIAGQLQGAIGTADTFLYAAFADICFAVMATLYLHARNNSNFKMFLSRIHRRNVGTKET